MDTTLIKFFSFSLFVIAMCFWFIFIPTHAESQMGKKISNTLGMEFVYIAPATFIMGSPSSVLLTVKQWGMELRMLYVLIIG